MPEELIEKGSPLIWTDAQALVIKDLQDEINMLKKFISDIDTHSHDSELKASEKLIANVKKRKDVSEIKSDKAKLKSAEMHLTEGKLADVVECIETWVSPFLHSHEVVKEAAKEYKVAEAAYVAAKSELES